MQFFGSKNSNKVVISFGKGVAIRDEVCYNTPINHESEEQTTVKKRILCLLLSAVLLLTLLPLGAVSAKAASELATSQEAVNLLKAFEGFSAKPYWDYSQYTVGYGTRCPDEDLERYRRDGITEEEAETLLRTYLASVEKSINSFADKNGLSLSQNQFDAIILFSYNCGTAWLYETSQFRTAILEGTTGNQLIHAMTLWCNAGGSILTGLIRRRLAEANLYLNGVYSTTPPANYCYVLYNANGGKTNPRIQGYDSNLTATPIPTPTYEGYGFDGWYTAASGGTKISVLDAGVRNMTLYAHWTQGGENTDSTVDISVGTAVDYRRQVTEGTLSVYNKPASDGQVIASLNKDAVVRIVSEHENGGVKWGRISSSGWIDLSKTVETASLGTPVTPVEITVQYNGVNLRQGPGTDYPIVGVANTGDKKTITATATGTGYTWGEFDGGWIALTFTNYDSVSNGGQTTAPTEPETQPTQPEETKPTEPEPTEKSKMGTVNTTDLRIRSGPSTAYEVLGYLNTGDRVEILEQKSSGSMIWGKISKGWISMDYVDLDEDKTTGGTTAAPENSGTAVSKVGTVTTDDLRIRSGPGLGNSVLGYLSGGTKVTITEEKSDGSMIWGKMDKGWISLDYVSFDSTGSSGSSGGGNNSGSANGSGSTGGGSAQGSQTGTVHADGGLRIRTGPSTSYAVAGYLDDGASVTLLETRSGWGRISQGWISLDYVRLSGSGSTGTPSGETKTVNTDCLNIRSGAGLGNTIVGYLYYGEKVTVTETTTVEGMTWGKTSKGWISMDYVK